MPLAVCKLEKKKHGNPNGMLRLSTMNNYWGFISLSVYHGGNLRIEIIHFGSNRQEEGSK